MDGQPSFVLGHPVPPQQTAHRRQQSLEEILQFGFTDPAPLQKVQRAQALILFNQLLARYRANSPADGYDVALLAELLYEHAQSEVAKANILQYFLKHVSGLEKEEQQDFDFFERLVASQQTHDNGVLFTSLEPIVVAPVETAHIIPRTIMARVSTNDGLNKAQLATLHILNLFDPGVVDVIDGEGIDSPRNALLLTKDWHDTFGKFRIYFDRPDDQIDTYVVRAANPVMRVYGLPQTVRFESDRIELPSPRLFAIHKAISIMMHLTGAGEYIDNYYRDDAIGHIAADGTTDLASFLVLGLLKNPIRAH
ncbi:MAG: hypothetical protein M1829_002235 [Trizodia sp. TS-e1964]|nr:MAG: hypothetical protein M1829_002235 [Trizodia sp. TS-e1964]